MEKEQLKELFRKYHEGTCTEEEKALLEAWYLQFNEEDPDISSRRIKAIGNRIFRELPGNESGFIRIGLQLLAAAMIAGIIVSIFLKLSFPPQLTKAGGTTPDITPGSNTAVLTLSNGKKIDLSKVSAGQLAAQSGTQIFKTSGGQIIYHPGNSNVGSNMESNNIAVPSGGQWQVILPDGTRVWLNSASSLDYPATFAKKKDRIVHLTGEAYFEVAKDKHHPFIVQTEHQTVKVLGTHFNINSYPDEPSTRTTLAEGSVKVSLKDGRSKLLQPGHKAILQQGQLSVVTANVADDLAWKNGSFHFTDQSIQSIMRQIARWYNIEVYYDADLSNEGLNGRISRYKNLSQVLKALEATQTVHFKVEGRRITVMK